jgi:hypothetical protein
MVTSLGNPTQAYLLASKQQIAKSNRFRLFLVYRPQAALYVMHGTFENGKACIALNKATSLTLYRFRDPGALQAALDQFLSTRTGALPPPINATTDRAASDFAAMAQNPTGNCMTLR